MPPSAERRSSPDGWRMPRKKSLREARLALQDRLASPESAVPAPAQQSSPLAEGAPHLCPSRLFADDAPSFAYGAPCVYGGADLEARHPCVADLEDEVLALARRELELSRRQIEEEREIDSPELRVTPDVRRVSMLLLEESYSSSAASSEPPPPPPSPPLPPQESLPLPPRCALGESEPPTPQWLRAAAAELLSPPAAAPEVAAAPSSAQRLQIQARRIRHAAASGPLRTRHAQLVAGLLKRELEEDGLFHGARELARIEALCGGSGIASARRPDWAADRAPTRLARRVQTGAAVEEAVGAARFAAMQKELAGRATPVLSFQSRLRAHDLAVRAAADTVKLAEFARDEAERVVAAL